jgi:hypothetical protein
MKMSLNPNAHRFHSFCCPECGSAKFSVRRWHLDNTGGVFFEWVCETCENEWQQVNHDYIGFSKVIDLIRQSAQ